MSVSNLSIVFGPTLLGAPPQDGGLNLEHMSFQCKVRLNKASLRLRSLTTGCVRRSRPFWKSTTRSLSRTMVVEVEEEGLVKNRFKRSWVFREIVGPVIRYPQARSTC